MKIVIRGLNALANVPAHLWLFLVAIYFGWNTVVFKPLYLMMVFLHELSHGLAAKLTGGSIISLAVAADGNGVATTMGGSRFLVLVAGFLGSSILGASIFMLATHFKAPKVLAMFFGMVMIAIALFYMPATNFGFWYSIGLGALAIALGYYLPEWFARSLLQFVGLASCMYALAEVWGIARGKNPQPDMENLRQMTHIPAAIYGWLALIGLVIFVLAVLATAAKPSAAQTEAKEATATD